MLLASGVLAACLAVPPGSDHIVAADLAAPSPAFAAVDPAAVIGWAPSPGVARVFTVPELRRLAARLGSPSKPQAGLCIERKVAPPDPDRLLAALQSEMPEGRVILLDFSRAPIPEGELRFPRSGLRRAGGALYWSGYVSYASRHKFAIWAKIRARSAQPVVVAARDLTPGRAIERAQLRIETPDDIFLSGRVHSIEEVVGKWPRRSIRAGAAILAQWLELPPDVIRGEPVRVEVWSGGAHLQLDARAESTGGRGERVSVLNPGNQKRFFARVTGKGLATTGALPAGRAEEQKP